jgi:hypothetical protein
VLAFLLVLIVAIAGYVYISRTRRRMESYAFPLEKSSAPEWDETALSTVALASNPAHRQSSSSETPVAFASNASYATASAARQPGGYADLKPGHKTYARATLRRTEDKETRDTPNYTYVDNDAAVRTGNSTAPYYTAPGAAAGASGNSDGEYVEATRNKTAKQPSPYAVSDNDVANARRNQDRDGYEMPVAQASSSGYAAFNSNGVKAGQGNDGTADEQEPEGFGMLPEIRSDGRSSIRLASVSRRNPLVMPENRYETNAVEAVPPYEGVPSSRDDENEFI